MRILKFIFILFSCQLFAQNATFSTSEAKAFKESVSSKAETIENLQADFKQLKFMKTMEKTVESDGHIWYASPGRLKWSYTSPYDYELLFKDSSLYIIEDGKTRKMNTGNSELFEKMGELVAGSFNGRILEMDELFKTDFARYGKFVKATVTPCFSNFVSRMSSSLSVGSKTAVNFTLLALLRLSFSSEILSASSLNNCMSTTPGVTGLPGKCPL